MTSTAELRKIVPFPELCPICGRELTDDNAEITHVVPPVRGGTDEPDNLHWICSECKRKTEERADELVAYYSKLVELQGKTASPLFLKRLAWTTVGSEIRALDEPGPEIFESTHDLDSPNLEDAETRRFAEVVAELAEAFDDEDLTDRKTVVINTNEFSFVPGFPIDEHREVLYRIANERTGGNRWNLDLDENGKVVLSE